MHRFDIHRLFAVGSAMLGRNTDHDATHAEVLSDEVITARIKMKLLAHAVTGAHEFQVETIDGVVALSGCVGTREARDVALQLAEHAEGVHSVIDAVVVRRTD